VDVFKWTVPEPDHRPDRMGAPELAYWRRVRRRGPEWFVVSKGLLFLAVLPASLHGLHGAPIGFVSLTGSWVAGLVFGTCVWLRRERRFARALAELPAREPEADEG